MEEGAAIDLGLNFLHFQYHHLVVFLTRSHESSKSTCLVSARESLILLDRLVSNSSQVYNGIVW